MAFKQNISFMSVGEDVKLSEIGRALTRHTYGPLFSGTASATYANPSGGEAEVGSTVDVGVTQALPTGGEVAVRGSSQWARIEAGEFDEELSSSLRLVFSQPLLRDSGRLVYREGLTQAEREVVYAVRALELGRQDLAIDTVSRFYDILGAKKAADIYKARVEDALIQRERSEARHSVGRESGVDVARAKIQESSAEQAYRDQVVAYEQSLDQLKLFLNLPVAEEIGVTEEKIAYVPVELHLDKSIALARENRLDLLTARERLQDAERKLALARNDLRNQLDFSAGSSVTSEDETEWNVGLSFPLPLDKWQVRSNYEREIISYSRTRRGVSRTEDEVVLAVIGTVRSLRRSEATLRIQELVAEDAARRLEQAKIDYGRGKGTNRDVVEAQNEVANAQNQVVRAQIDYIIGKLQLQREIGTLRIDEEGNWLR